MTPNEALASLLTTQSLLLAVLALIYGFASPSNLGVRKKLAGAGALGIVVIIALGLVAIGSGFAWAAAYLNPFPPDFSTRVIAIAMFTPIVVEPLIGVPIVVGLFYNR